MNKILIVCLYVGFGFSQILQVDSIIDPGTWTNPDNIFTSDDLYAEPGGNNDVLDLQIIAPIDTSAALDSVKVFLEQYVSDTTRAAWRFRPVINGNPGTISGEILGTATDEYIMFDISPDITGWADLFDLAVQLRNTKVGGGPGPEWYADYLYVHVYTDAGVFESEYGKTHDSRLIVPSIVTGALTFTYYLDTPSLIAVEVYNSIGERILSRSVNGNAGENKITLGKVNELSAGTYYIRVKSADHNVESVKFIITE